MRLGKRGYQWVEDIASQYTDGASMCTTWQQEFFEGFWSKAQNFQDEGYITEKQIVQLNKIADIYGVVNAKPEYFEDR